MAKKDAQQQPQILEEAEKLLTLLGINGKVEVIESQEEEPVKVLIETEETGIFIGRHGETISSFELLLNQIVNRGRENWQRIIVDTGDYRSKEEDRLSGLAREAAEHVKQSGEPYSIYELTPAQRRIVHTILSEDPGVVTRSEGEGRERRLVVELKA